MSSALYPLCPFPHIATSLNPYCYIRNRRLLQTLNQEVVGNMHSYSIAKYVHLRFQVWPTIKQNLLDIFFNTTQSKAISNSRQAMSPFSNFPKPSFLHSFAVFLLKCDLCELFVKTLLAQNHLTRLHYPHPFEIFFPTKTTRQH